MMTTVLRLAFAVAATLSLSGIPIYPGATLDAERMKDVATQQLNHSTAAYYTSDSFEKVVAFYKSQKGAKLQPSSFPAPKQLPTIRVITSAAFPREYPKTNLLTTKVL
jgi:hypothetical protein